MSARRRTFSAPLTGRALLLLLGQLGCSPQYELLRTSDGDGAGGASSTSGNPSVGGAASVAGAEFGGNPARAGGDTGGTDSGGFTSGGTGFVSSGTSGFDGTSGNGGNGNGGNGNGGGGNALGQACTAHGECAFGAVCSDYRCQACPATPLDCVGPCEHGFQPRRLARNGCEMCECVPGSDCGGNADCPSNEICYAGSQCEDGCNDPLCCFGNRCSPAGCAASRPPLCLAFGCRNGESCLAACDATSCECDGAAWVCESTTGGAPVASCPQACAPP